MAYNLGYVSTSYNLGYVGAYTGGLYPYVLTSHGVADTNSFMAAANFGTTQPVDIGVVTDFDSAKIVVDWQAVSDGQLWRQDINTLAAVTVNATTDTTATCTISYRVTETGETGTFDVTVNVVAEVTTTVPQGTTTIGTISKTETTASIPYTYSGTDQTGFEYSLDGTTWRSAPNPIPLSDLTAGTGYSISVRPFNPAGTGTAGTASFTTLLGASISSVSVPAAGTYAVGDTLSFTPNWSEAVNVTGVPAVNFTIGGQPRQANYTSGDGTAATAFSYTVQTGDEGSISVSSLTLDGGTIRDLAGNDVDLTLNAVGDTSGVLVDGVGPNITVTPLTTIDTAPIVSGSAGDAASLTLVVNGVTYNPVPSGGVWSQQLPTLAINDYLMTLDGEDAQGNAATQRQAFLRIVSEINPPGNPRKLKRTLIRSLAGKTLRRTL